MADAMDKWFTADPGDALAVLSRLNMLSSAVASLTRVPLSPAPGCAIRRRNLKLACGRTSGRGH